MDEKKLMEKYDKLNRKMQRYFARFFSDSQLTCIQGLVLHYIIVESERRDVFPKDLEEFSGNQRVICYESDQQSGAGRFIYAGKVWNLMEGIKS